MRQQQERPIVCRLGSCPERWLARLRAIPISPHRRRIPPPARMRPEWGRPVWMRVAWEVRPACGADAASAAGAAADRSSARLAPSDPTLRLVYVFISVSSSLRDASVRVPTGLPTTASHLQVW